MTRTLMLGQVVLLLQLALPHDARARQSPAPAGDAGGDPGEVAQLFLRSVRAVRWRATAELLAPETLARFRTAVTLISDADAGGEVRAWLVQTDSSGLAALDDGEVFARSIGTVIDDMPGLMHALYDRVDDVLGHVPETPATDDPTQRDRAHVVYRTTARLSGAVPEVKVMQLVRTADGWRVRWSDELEVIEAALRGVVR